MNPAFNVRDMRPTRAGFGEGVLEAARMEPRVVGLGLDITASVGMNLFAGECPDRFFSLGIAEQNAMAVAAGLALCDKIPVLSTYAVFSAFRSADQLRISVCYNNLHVIVGGAHAGISVGPDGATHQALEDLAIVRTLPNMTVLSPCDATQARLATLAAILDLSGPVYIRYGREAVPDFTSPDMPFVPGQAQLLASGRDVLIVATGHMVWEALQAARQVFEELGIHASVLNMHTIKPIDKDTLIALARECGTVVTAEEHQVTGGLGSAVAEVLATHCPLPVERVGMPDIFGESGPPEQLMQKYGLDSQGIVHAIHRAMARKTSGAILASY